MLQVKTPNNRKDFAESRRLMWAYARQAKVSYFHLLCLEKALYAIYDEGVFCGCAVQGSVKGSACVLCLFPSAAYCEQTYCTPIGELLAEILNAKPLFIDYVQIAEPSYAAAREPLRQT